MTNYGSKRKLPHHRGQPPTGARRAAELPLSILQYAIRTKSLRLCDDASKERPFSADQCVTSKHVRSVLCLPLIKQVKSVGLLYLENNVAASVFTPARIAALQAAISLKMLLWRTDDERGALVQPVRKRPR